MSKHIQNSLLAFIMAASITVWFKQAHFELVNAQLFHIPVVLIILFGVCLVIAEDVRDSFKKVLRFEQREDRLPLWQVGIGMLFFFAQIGFVEVFMRTWMAPRLDGMPLYIVFSFMNAFLATVIYQELFYKEEQVKQFKFKKLK